MLRAFTIWKIRHCDEKREVSKSSSLHGKEKKVMICISICILHIRWKIRESDWFSGRCLDQSTVLFLVNSLCPFPNPRWHLRTYEALKALLRPPGAYLIFSLRKGGLTCIREEGSLIVRGGVAYWWISFLAGQNEWSCSGNTLHKKSHDRGEFSQVSLQSRRLKNSTDHVVT